MHQRGHPALAKEGTAESGYRNSTGVAGPLGRIPLQDTPYSLNVTSGELIENRAAHTEGDALMTNPSVSVSVAPNAPSASLVARVHPWLQCFGPGRTARRAGGPQLHRSAD